MMEGGVGTNPLRQLSQLGTAQIQYRNGDNLVDGINPNDTPVPHIITFTGYTGQMGKIYRNPDEAWRNSRENARYMRNDISLMECVEARQRAIALLPWHLTTDRPKDPLEQDLCKTLTNMINQIPRFTEFRRSLQEAIWFGRSGIQLNYGVKNYYGIPFQIPTTVANRMAWMPINGDKLAFRYDDGRIGIRIGYTFPSDSKDFDERIKLLEQSDTAGTYVYDGTRVRKIEYTTEYGRVYFLDEDELDRVVIHKHMIEDADFETPLVAGALHGVGLRSKIYWTWFQKQNTMALLMEYLERSALGFEIWTYPQGNDNFLTAVQNAAFNRVGAGKNIVFLPVLPGMPDLCRMEHVETGLAGIELVDTVVHRYFEWQIKRYVLGQVLSTEPESGGLGSSGITDFQQASLYDILAYDARNVEETLSDWVNRSLKARNRAVLPLGAENIPVRFVLDTESEEMEKRLEAIQRIYEMGAEIRKEDLYQIAGVEKPGQGDEVVSSIPSPLNPMGGPQLGVPGEPGPQTPGPDEHENQQTDTSGEALDQQAGRAPPPPAT
jgi:phage gp29-like protein